MHAYSQMRRDPASRLHFGGSRQTAAGTWLQVALCKYHLDAVEWLLAAPDTRIAALVADIRRWILEPYLWIGDRLCGVMHRGHFLYGVRHTTDTPYIDAKGTRRYYRYGLLHRIGAPAVIGEDIMRYYRDGSAFRESGPITLGSEFLVYPRGSRLAEMSHNRVRRMVFLGRISVAVSQYETGIIIWIRRSCFDRYEITIGDDGCLAFRADHRPIFSDAFREIVDVLREYVRDYPIEATCEREWSQARAGL